MYNLILAGHNLVRWLVLIAAIVAVARAFLGWRGQKSWTEQDNRWGLIFTVAFDIQLLLGLLLYFVLSPVTTSAFADFSAAMKDNTVNFFLTEHLGAMLVALVLAHVGRARSRKQEDATSKHKQAAIFFGLSLLLILMAIPWWRPLLPF